MESVAQRGKDLDNAGLDCCDVRLDDDDEILLHQMTDKDTVFEKLHLCNWEQKATV